MDNIFASLITWLPIYFVHIYGQDFHSLDHVTSDLFDSYLWKWRQKRDFYKIIKSGVLKTKQMKIE